jgi:hypothetical protein
MKKYVVGSAMYHFVAENDATIHSRSPYLHQYLDSWWVVHPEKGLVFYGEGYGHPQCNRSKELSERLCPEWGTIKFFERVLVPLNLSDYKE